MVPRLARGDTIPTIPTIAPPTATTVRRGLSAECSSGRVPGITGAGVIRITAAGAITATGIAPAGAAIVAVTDTAATAGTGIAAVTEEHARAMAALEDLVP